MFPLVAPHALLFVFSSLAFANILAPACNSSVNTTWNWSFNSLDQNPCTVAAYLISTCNGGSFTVPSLQPGYTYVGPDTPDGSHPCKCSTVTYSLLSACGGCQGETWLPWSDYASNCTQTLPFGSFPSPIPSGTRLPQWALLDVSSGNDWNSSQSLIVGDTPEISPGALLGFSGVVTVAASASGAATVTSAQSPHTTLAKSVTVGDSPSALSNSTPTGGSSSNKGTVVGGVVGGVVVIFIAITRIFLSLRRRQPQAQTATLGTGVSQDSQLPTDEFQLPLTDEGMHTVSTLPGDPVVPIKLYDPSDPTTFPGYEGVPQSPDTPQGPEPLYNGTADSLATMQTSRTRGYHGLPIV